MSSCHLVILSKLKLRIIMVIEIKRCCRSPYGVDGVLTINGRTICATVEHPHNHLPEGSYPVELKANREAGRRMPTLPQGATIRAGNGGFTLRDGSIVVGVKHIKGVVVKSGEVFERLYERIEKNVKRKNSVVVTIK